MNEPAAMAKPHFSTEVDVLLVGAGIMSAIDFSMEVDKEENPKGDRVVITMNGKFLPYKAW